jgi:hypothetical protein
MALKGSEIFPRDIFVEPKTEITRDNGGRPVTKPKFNFSEEPLHKKLLELEAVNSDSLRRAINNDLTIDFIKSLHYKATRTPPENINIEIKGQTRSGKSTVGITLGILISRWWGHEFTIDNILPNQGELLYKLKDAKYGETFLVDEQTPETYGEGILRETSQLGSNLNICAKKCNNLIFIYPPNFVSRNSPFGLEAIAKDTLNKYVKCFYYDLRRKEYGGTQIPRGYVVLPKFRNTKYKNLSKSKWSERRLANWEEKHYDYDSFLEEEYEGKKDSWIKDVRNMDASVRDKKKHELATILADDDKFLSIRRNGEKEAYVLLLVNSGQVIEMTRSEIKTVVDMANVIATIGEPKKDES